MNIFCDFLSNLLYIFSFLLITVSFLRIKLIFRGPGPAVIALLVLVAALIERVTENELVYFVTYWAEFTLLLMILGEVGPGFAAACSFCEITFLALLCMIPDELLIPLLKGSGIVFSEKAEEIIAILFSMFFLFLIRIRYQKYRNLNLIETMKKHWAVILLSVSLDIFMVSFVNFLIEDAGNLSPFYYGYVALITIGSYIQLGILFEMINASDSYRREQIQLEANIRAQNDNYLYQQERNQKTRRFRHDIRNSLLVLQQLMEQKNYTAAERYIEEMNGTVEQFGSYVTLNNGFAEIAVNQAVQKAREKGIRLLASGRFPDHCELSIGTITTIFANLLSNAIESAEKYGGDIILDVRHTEKTIMISLTNQCDPAMDIDGEIPQTTKADRENHGLGLQNVCECVSRNGGDILFQAENGTFRVLVSLKNESMQE